MYASVIFLCFLVFPLWSHVLLILWICLACWVSSLSVLQEGIEAQHFICNVPVVADLAAMHEWGSMGRFQWPCRSLFHVVHVVC